MEYMKFYVIVGLDYTIFCVIQQHTQHKIGDTFGIHFMYSAGLFVYFDWFCLLFIFVFLCFLTAQYVNINYISKIQDAANIWTMRHTSILKSMTVNRNKCTRVVKYTISTDDVSVGIIVAFFFLLKFAPYLLFNWSLCRYSSSTMKCLRDYNWF